MVGGLTAKLKKEKRTKYKTKNVIKGQRMKKHQITNKTIFN